MAVNTATVPGNPLMVQAFVNEKPAIESGIDLDFLDVNVPAQSLENAIELADAAWNHLSRMFGPVFKFQTEHTVHIAVGVWQTETQGDNGLWTMNVCVASEALYYRGNPGLTA